VSVLLLSSKNLKLPLEVAFFFFLCPFHLDGFIREVREAEEVLDGKDGLEFRSQSLQEMGHLLGFCADIIRRIVSQLCEFVDVFTDGSPSLS
jgi:hypothetical protein